MIELLEARLVTNVGRGILVINHALHQAFYASEVSLAGVRFRQRLTIETWSCALMKEAE